LITCVLSAALATNNTNYYDQITNIIFGRVDTSQQDYILSSFAALYATDQLDQAIQFVLSDEVRDNAKIRGLYACRRCSGRFNVWSGLTADDGEAWDNLASIFGSGFSMSDLTAVFETFASEVMFENVQEFYSVSDRTTSANARVVNQTIESVNRREVWLVNNRQDVKSFLIATGYYSSDNNDSSASKWYDKWWFILIIILFCGALIAAIVYHLCRLHQRKKNPSGYVEINEKGGPFQKN